jgi:hypothetical protein
MQVHLGMQVFRLLARPGRRQRGVIADLDAPGDPFGAGTDGILEDPGLAAITEPKTEASDLVIEDDVIGFVRRLVGGQRLCGQSHGASTVGKTPGRFESRSLGATLTGLG